MSSDQRSTEYLEDSEIKYVDPDELSPIGNEEVFAVEVDKMVTDEAPRLFALCEEIGNRADAVTVAWGMSFSEYAEVTSAAHDGVRGTFSSAERARELLSKHCKVRLVWVDEAQNQANAA